MIEQWIDARRAAEMLGEAVCIVRQKMSTGIIKARDIALPGSKLSQWRTTMQWLREYQSPQTTVTAVPQQSAAPVLLSGLTYKEYAKLQRQKAQQPSHVKGH